MTIETKRDVFDELLEIAGNAMDQAMSAQYPSDENGCAQGGIGKKICDILDPIEKRYDAASPCKLPVIPKAVNEYIEDAKASHYELLDAMTKWTLDQPVFDWIHNNSDTFARAWSLGAWRVEETGEVVELEDEEMNMTRKCYVVSGDKENPAKFYGVIQVAVVEYNSQLHKVYPNQVHFEDEEDEEMSEELRKNNED